MALLPGHHLSLTLILFYGKNIPLKLDGCTTKVKQFTMLTEILKILIVSKSIQNAQTIKAEIFEKIPKSIFSIVNVSNENFSDKLGWMNYDIAIADQSSKSHIINDTINCLKRKFPLLPIIRIQEEHSNGTNETSINTLAKQSQTLPIQIEKSLLVNIQLGKNRTLKNEFSYENKKLIFKALTLLEQSQHFVEKKFIQQSLEKLNEQLHSHKFLDL